MNYQISEQLHEHLQNEEVEDIVLSPRGLSFYAHGAWTGPQKLPESEKSSSLVFG
jgi:hypothetical protein